MFDWHAAHDTRPLGMGLWELCPAEHDAECLERIAHEPTFAELRRLQSRTTRFRSLQRKETMRAGTRS
jgi:hypothetical protein